MRVLRLLSIASALALGVAYAPQAAARSEYYGSQCAGCHGATPTTCNGCHRHGAGNVAGQISKTTFAPGETMTFTVTAGTRTGWWRAALLDHAGRLVKTASVASGLSTTITAPAPAAAGSYTWRVAWYGNEVGGTGGATWLPDASNPGHGFRTAAAPAFTVAAAAAPTIALDPGSLNLGSVNVGSSASLAAQVRNTGTATLTISNIARCTSPATSAEFGWSPVALPLAIAPGASAALTVTYAPTAAGADSGCLALTSDASNGPTTNLAVSGTGVVPAAPRIAVSPTSLSFGNVTVGESVARSFTISNTGTATLAGTVARASGTSPEYSASPASFSVAAGASQVVTVTYAPTDLTADAGAVAVASNDAQSPTVSVSFSGTGVPVPASNIVLDPTSLPLGTVTVGGSASRTVSVRNTGTAPLDVTQIARCASPATSAEFTWSPAGPFSVAAGGSTTVTVTYRPADAGADAGCIAFTSNDAADPVVSLDVSGTGQLPAAPKIAVSPSALAFGNVIVGASSAGTLTISNTGNAVLTGSLARAAGTSAEFAASAASFSVAAGASQQVTVTYAPTGVGSDAGSFVLTSNDATAPSLSVGVSGAGVAAPAPAIALSPAALAFGTVTLGDAPSLTAQVRNAGNATLHVTAVAPCPGTSAAFAWTVVAPFSVEPGASVPLSVTYRPTTAGTDSGCVAVSSDDPASATVNLGLSGTAVAQAIPAIAVDPGALDFGTVLVGSTASRPAEVRNTGTGTLHVSSISLCAGTPATFGWSPAAPFDVAPGARVVVTATYAPTAAATEAGCLALESDDPARPRVEVAVAGAGAQPPVPSTDADVDIVDLRIPGRFKSELRPLRPKAALRNTSAVPAHATATLRGVLDGATVYDEARPVELPAGGSAVLEFSSYVPPVVRSTIEWTLTVEDQDPDVDVATARTVIAYRNVAAWASAALASSADEGGGCSSGGGAGLAPLGALALLGVVRRRRSAARRA